jgi:hypothetical protein
VIIGEEHKVFAVPPCARSNQAVTAEEGNCSADFLHAVVVDAFVLVHGHLQVLEIGA